MQRPAADIFVLASTMLDLSVVVDRFPMDGETLAGRDLMRTPGGKGSNQAVQAARCGAAVALLAGLGDDAAGATARALWAAEGIVATVVPGRPGEASGHALVIVEAGGANRIVVVPGANAAITPADVDRADPPIAACRLVLAQLETPLPATLRAFALARAAGVATVLNAAPAADALPVDLWTLTDVLIVNEVEAAMLAGAPSGGDAVVLGPRLLGRVAGAVVITLGARGAMLWRHGSAPLHCLPAAVSVVDTTGAGDAFTGAFAAAWARGAQAGEALACGVAAGSLACERRGVVPALADGARVAAAALALRAGLRQAPNAGQ